VDVTVPNDTPVTTRDLVVLGLDAGAPAPAGASFWVTNAGATVRTLRHPDAFNTLYLELRFAAGGLASLDGQPLGSGDSVLVSITPLSGGYGFTLGPAGLAFAGDALPTALFSFGRYADPSVADGLFPTSEAYVGALEVWRETGSDRWSVARGSSVAGIDEIRATVEAPGRYWLAAVPQ
jgi:hypothetical protein